MYPLLNNYYMSPLEKLRSNSKLCAAAPLPSRGKATGRRAWLGNGVRGGVCISLTLNKFVTPPLPLPYMGGECHAACSLAAAYFFMWTHHVKSHRSYLIQLCVRNELTMAVSTVMMNWMMVFQVFRSLRDFI